MRTTFSELPLGTRFIFRGVEYVNLALNLAEDEMQVRHVFQNETEVEVDPSVVPPGTAVPAAIAGDVKNEK